MYYTFTDNNNCTNFDSLQIHVIDPDSAEAGPNDTVCIDNGTFSMTSFNPGGGTWSGTGISPTGVFDPAAAGNGPHTITYTIGSGTCTNFDTKVVIVYPLPNVQVSQDQAICFGDVITIGASGADTYTWSASG